MNTRREFLKIGSLAIVGGLFLSGNEIAFGQTAQKKGYFQIPAEIYAERANSLSVANFEPLVNSSFVIKRKNIGDAVLKLVEVVNDKDKRANSGGKISTESFSLIFQTGRGVKKLADKIYTVNHPELGEFRIFLSSVGRSGNRYQAVFNRLYV